MKSSTSDSSNPPLSLLPSVPKNGVDKNGVEMKDSMGRWRIGSLFWEQRNNSDYPPLFTMKDSEHAGLPSLKAIYFSYDHVPYHEYEFALTVLGSWEHWKVLCASPGCGDMISAWRDELTIRNKARAIKHMIELSKEDSSIGLNASRYLADEGYLPKRAGRTTREEKVRQQKIDAGVHMDLEKDFKRMSLKAVN